MPWPAPSSALPNAAPVSIPPNSAHTEAPHLNPHLLTCPLLLRSPPQLSGAIIAPVALLFMVYALLMYRKRTYQVGGGPGQPAGCTHGMPLRAPPCHHPSLFPNPLSPPLLLRLPAPAPRSPPQILRRETVRYDDQRGPLVLTVILAACFLLAYVLSLVWIF